MDAKYFFVSYTYSIRARYESGKGSVAVEIKPYRGFFPWRDIEDDLTNHMKATLLPDKVDVQYSIQRWEEIPEEAYRTEGRYPKKEEENG